MHECCGVPVTTSFGLERMMSAVIGASNVWCCACQAVSASMRPPQHFGTAPRHRIADINRTWHPHPQPRGQSSEAVRILSFQYKQNTSPNRIDIHQNVIPLQLRTSANSFMYLTYDAWPDIVGVIRTADAINQPQLPPVGVGWVLRRYDLPSLDSGIYSSGWRSDGYGSWRRIHLRQRRPQRTKTAGGRWDMANGRTYWV